MPFLRTESTGTIEISQADYNWIAERMNTAPSGTVSFSSAAIKRYRKITGQEFEEVWKIKSEMLNEFGHLA
ncbi:hypothetical protein GW796_09180 [archaeon]|nr:hypothetical protein [archaeon]NCT58902.1 hypothetical protein [archaeon]